MVPAIVLPESTARQAFTVNVAKDTRERHDVI
jgi:hypothetical protein